jgi:lipoprotein-releasing system ATP-binding protein
MILEAKHIRKIFGTLEVLKGVDFTVTEGEVVAIMGASGAGKSTLLQILGTLLTPDEGSLTVEGTDVLHLSGKALSAFRNRRIGFVFQAHHLLPEFTALENVCIPALIKGTPMKEAQARAMELLALMKVDGRAAHKPQAMSGGEQQRVAVARALMNSPMAVLADEPSGNLDSQHARELHELFFRLREQYNQTFIIVTHNEELAAMADRKITIIDGKNTE